MRLNGRHEIISGCSTELETGPSTAGGLSGAVNAANALVNQSGSEEFLRSKFSNAISSLSNSWDVSGHSSTACELASEIFGQESELSLGGMIVTSETLTDLLGD